MLQNMVTLLVRCSYRPEGFKRTLASIPSSVQVICSYDDERALSYIPDHIRKIRVYKHNAAVWYDNYCNDLKALVEVGHFAFLDEGDVIIEGSLEKLKYALLTNKAVICQFTRPGKVKPSADMIRNRQVIRGKIGMPCLFLHHSLKNIAHLDGGKPAADYHWIKAVSRRVNCKFIAIPVVHAPRKDGGLVE